MNAMTPRIVLADDHPFMRAGVVSALASRGMDVTAAVGDGDQALDAIHRETPDVVILDVNMPVRDGIATLQTLRRSGDMRPVILLTAEMDDKALAAAMEAEVNAIVFKDRAETHLHEAVRAVMAGERYIEPEVIDRANSLPTGEQVSLKDALSPRELAIAEAVAAGKRNRDIAAEVGMTEGSIKVYLHRVYEKLGIDNRTELAVMVLNQR